MLKKIYRLFLLAIVLWSAGFVFYADQSLSMRIENPDEVTDAIVVLTGGDKRIEAGLALLAEGRAKNLFISGVHPDVKKKEILAMRQDRKPLSGRVILGCEARTTFDNAREIKAWLQDEKLSSFRLVTSNYHMKRALLDLSLVMPDAKIIPHPVRQPGLDAKAPELWVLLFTEYHKFMFRWLSSVITQPPSNADAGKQCLKR